eukprot:scaffold1707_cov88-Cylindrotheca_fusiformis.AAC.3
MDPRVLDKRLRSVLSHRLGLPLLYALHDGDPATLKYLGRKRVLFTPNNERRLNGILAKAMIEWKTGRIPKEPQLTRLLVEIIIEQLNSFNALNELKVVGVEESKRETNIIFREAKSKKDVLVSTPFTVIEFGLGGIDSWWKKLDQCIKYVDRMGENSQQWLPCVRFERPLLLAVMTYDAASNERNKKCKFRIGVFLCCPRKGVDNENDDGHKMLLLWHAKSNTLEDASKMFGRLLRVTADFRSWRDNSKDEQSNDGYEYFSSSSCCKIRNNRDNSSMAKCGGIVGNVEKNPVVKLITGKDTGITNLDDTDPNVEDMVPNGKDMDPNKNLWNKSNGKLEVVPGTEFDVSRTIITRSNRRHDMLLLIIAVRYRPGSHIAKKPKDFVPIINQLQELHDKGFVHGDIRAFNTVFGEKENEGSWLIDFDFGGKIGDSSTKYPTGFRARLDDGYRMGEGGNPILTWHDWFALGQLIFYVHKICRPKEVTDEINVGLLLFKLDECSEQWEELDNDPTFKMIEQLKEFLCDLDRRGWTVRPTGQFEGILHSISVLRNKLRGFNNMDRAIHT